MPDAPRDTIGDAPWAGRPRFRPEALFRPRSVVAVGAGGSAMLARLRRAGFAGAAFAARGAAEIAGLPAAADLAVLCDPAPEVGPVFAGLAARGTRAALVLGMARGIAGAVAATGVRALGPGSFGLAVPAIGLDATSAHLPVPSGRLALIAQSAALCRAVLDWAEPNGVGFSHIIGIGGNADIGFALALDWLARDPGTGVILLDIRRVKSMRLLLSAARAAAVIRPVVAIRPGVRLGDPDGDGEAALEAALSRAGVLAVATVEELLAAAETLSRASLPRRRRPPARASGECPGIAEPAEAAPATGPRGRPPAESETESLAIVTNAVGPALLAADAVLREGVALARLTPLTRAALAIALPGALGGAPEAGGGAASPDGTGGGAALPDGTGGGADVPGGVGDIVYGGVETPIRLAEAASLLAAAPEIGGILVVHAPAGPADGAGIEALAAAAGVVKRPLLVCAMGETTGALHRRRLAAAGVPVFATPEQAVRGFAHLVRHRHSREAALELPPAAAEWVEPDRAAAARALAGGGLVREGEAAGAVLASYRIGPIEGPPLLVRVTDDAMLGPVIAIGAASPGHDLALDLPPLNLPLARAQFARTRIAALFSGAARQSVAEALVRVSQLVIDFPAIAALDIAFSPLAARIGLRPPGAAPQRLAIPPYPAALARRHEGGGEAFLLRPIRPEDAAAHAALFARLPQADVRYRFFGALRELSPERLARFILIDYEREMAFIAIRIASGETVGVARLVRESSAVAGQGDRGEFAVVVEPAAKGKGVASALMRALIGWARDQGMTMVTGQVLADNAAMLAFVHHLGFTVHRLPAESDVVEASLSLEPAR